MPYHYSAGRINILRIKHFLSGTQSQQYMWEIATKFNQPSGLLTNSHPCNMKTYTFLTSISSLKYTYACVIAVYVYVCIFCWGLLLGSTEKVLFILNYFLYQEEQQNFSLAVSGSSAMSFLKQRSKGYKPFYAKIWDEFTNTIFYLVNAF